MARSHIKMQRSGIEMGLWTGTYFWVVFAIHVSIAIPENNAKNSAPQSVNYCVTDFRRTPVRLQICSLQFALCSTAFFALFSGLAINSGILTRKNLFMPQSRSVPYVREKRRNWKKHMSEKDINHLVFLDESGVNINMTRHYARAWKNRRAVDKTPLNTPCNTTVLSSIRLNGDCAYTVYQGGTTA